MNFSTNVSNWRSSARTFEFKRFLGHFVHPLRNLLPNKKKKTPPPPPPPPTPPFWLKWLDVAPFKKRLAQCSDIFHQLTNLSDFANTSERFLVKTLVQREPKWNKHLRWLWEKDINSFTSWITTALFEFITKRICLPPKSIIALAIKISVIITIQIWKLSRSIFHL